MAYFYGDAVVGNLEDGDLHWHYGTLRQVPTFPPDASYKTQPSYQVQGAGSLRELKPYQSSEEDSINVRVFITWFVVTSSGPFRIGYLTDMTC